MPMGFLVRRAKGLKVFGQGEVNRLSTFLDWMMQKKAGETFDHIGNFVEGKVLDVGLGAGALAKLLINKGFKVEGVDVVNLSIYEDLSPKLVDGKKLPFKDKTFDTALLISVLHHTGDNQLEVLKEAKRVCKRLIVIEDTYRNFLERMVIAFTDRIANIEFYHHPYRTVSGWQEVFKKNKWRVVHQKTWSQFAFGFWYSRYCLFVLE